MYRTWAGSKGGFLMLRLGFTGLVSDIAGLAGTYFT